RSTPPYAPPGSTEHPNRAHSAALPRARRPRQGRAPAPSHPGRLVRGRCGADRRDDGQRDARHRPFLVAGPTVRTSGTGCFGAVDCGSWSAALSSPPELNDFSRGTNMALEKWDIDAGHSSIAFWVRHLVVAKVHGTFTKWSGSIELDPS